MLHLLGIDHAAFTVKFQGLDVHLTGAERGKVVRESSRKKCLTTENAEIAERNP